MGCGDGRGGQKTGEKEAKMGSKKRGTGAAR